MKDGILLLLVVAIFFGLMYSYCYGSIYYEAYKHDRDLKKKKKLALIKEEKFKQDLIRKKEAIDVKYKLLDVRRLEIQKEFKRLEEFNKIKTQSKHLQQS